MFIPLLLSLVSRNVRLRYSFLKIFFHLRLFDNVLFQYSQVVVISFSLSILILSWFGSSVLPVIYLSPRLIISIEYFSMPNSIPISWLYILIVCIRVSNCFSFFANRSMSSMYIIIIYSLEFFISAWADGISLEFEWQQASWSLQDSSQYSGRSQQSCSLNGLHSSSNRRAL